jgi:hypothetical protein
MPGFMVGPQAAFTGHKVCTCGHWVCTNEGHWVVTAGQDVCADGHRVG